MRCSLLPRIEYNFPANPLVEFNIGSPDIRTVCRSKSDNFVDDVSLPDPEGLGPPLQYPKSFVEDRTDRAPSERKTNIFIVKVAPGEGKAWGRVHP